MIASHPFWYGLVVACIVWYSSITLYVAVRGALDIRSMLRDLSQRESEATSPTQM